MVDVSEDRRGGSSATRRTVGRRRSARTGAGLGAVVVLAALVLSVASPARSAGQQGPFSICKHQRYALCAAASCLVYNQVAYCKCEVNFGDSISVPYKFSAGDICSVNRQGYLNGYMMSTYSLPPTVAVGGNQAIYTCRGSSANGAYAQCDGGFCFLSTRGRKFPGFSQRLQSDEIICSCPITVADPSMDSIGYQIVGPYPCQDSFFDNCTAAVANTNTGSTIAVGAPTGTARLLTKILDGSVPALNYCAPSH